MVQLSRYARLFLAFAMLSAICLSIPGFRAWERWKHRQQQAAFIERYNLFEKDMGVLWKCLLGTDDSPQDFLSSEQFALILTGKKGDECLTELTNLIKMSNSLDEPADYQKPLKQYNEAFVHIANSLQSLAESTANRAKIRTLEQQILIDGRIWSAYSRTRIGDLAQVRRFSDFIHCAMPSVTENSKGEEVSIYFLSRCTEDSKEKWFIDERFLGELQDKCLNSDKLLILNRKKADNGLLLRLAFNFDYLSSAIGICFKEINQKSISNNFHNLSTAWSEINKASLEIHGLGN